MTPEEIRKYKREYMKKLRAKNPEYKLKMNASNAEYKRKCYQEDPEWRAKHLEANRIRIKKRYQNDPIFRAYKSEVGRNYLQTIKGKENKKKSVYLRNHNLGFIPINDYFPESEAHHINKNQVIYIPSSLHKAYPHKQNKPESMILINSIAFQYLTDTIKQL